MSCYLKKVAIQSKRATLRCADLIELPRGHISIEWILRARTEVHSIDASRVFAIETGSNALLGRRTPGAAGILQASLT